MTIKLYTRHTYGVGRGVGSGVGVFPVSSIGEGGCGYAVASIDIFAASIRVRAGAKGKFAAAHGRV